MSAEPAGSSVRGRWVTISVDVVAAFNTAEAGLWATFAALTALLGGRARGLTPRLRAWLTVVFLAFGASDLVEISTGAWWRPPALLAYKGACLLGIVAGGWNFWHNRRARGAADRVEADPGRGP